MAIVGTASIRINAITTGFEAQIYRALKRVEDLANRGANRGPISALFEFDTKSFRDLAREGDATYDSINQLLRVAYRLQGAIAAAVPAVAQLAAGLFALGSQAAAATPALIVLPAAMSAIMQAAITAKLALGGVFKAVGELGKQKTGSVDRMPAKLAAIANAQTRLKAAQDGLNRAYREAAERLQQLGFDTEDAAIGQERAAMQLESARETLARVQDLPPNSRARKEAELAFREADLNYRRAIDRSNDLSEEQDRVSKNGTLDAEQQVEQSEEVVRAKREIEEATRDLLKAQKDLNAGNAAGMTEFNKLSKAAQDFAKYLASLKPEIQKLKDAAGKELFGPLQSAIQNLVDNFFPRLIPLLEKTGKALGNTADDFSRIVTEAVNLRNFEKVGDTNIYIIERLGTVVGNLYTAFLALLEAAGPLVRRFSDWVVTLTEGWKKTRLAKQATGELTDMFNAAGDVAAQLGDIFGNLAGGLMNMGRAASGPGSGGQMIFDALERSTQRFKEWSKTVLEDGSLEAYFRHAAIGFNKIAEIVGKVFKIIMKSATADENFVVLDSISKAVDNLGIAFNRVVGAGPAFGRFIEAFSRVILVTSEAGSIEVFFNILTGAMNVFSSLMENEVVRGIFKFLAAWHAARLAFGVIKTVFVTIGFYLIGAFRALYKAGSAVVKVFGFLTRMGFSGGMIAGIGAIVAVLILAFKYSEKFRKALGDLVSSVFEKLKSAISEIKEAFTELFGGSTFINFSNFFKRIGDFLAVTLVPLLEVVLIRAIDIVKEGIIALMKVLRGVMDVFFGLGDIVAAIVNLFTGDFSGAWESLKAGLGKIFGGIVIMIEGLIQAIKARLMSIPLFAIAFEALKIAIEAIGTALSWVWNNAIKPVFDVFASVVGKVADKFEPLVPVIMFIAKLVRNVLYIAFLIVFTTIGIIVAEIWRKIKALAEVIGRNLGGAFKVLKTIVLTTFAIIGGVIGVAFALIVGAAKATFAFLKEGFKNILPIARRVFDIILTVGKFLWAGISRSFSIAWGIISKAIPFVWNNVIKPVFGFILAYWKFVFNAVRKVFDVAWDVISKAVPFVWNNVIKPVFGFILAYWKFVFNAVKTVFETVWPIIWGGIQFAWNNVIKPVFTKIYEAFKFYWGLIKQAFDFVWPYIWAGIQFAWNNVIKPVFDLIASTFSTVWNAVKAAFDLVWPYIWAGIQFAWDNVIKPVFDLIGSVFSTVWNGIKAAFDLVWPVISGAISFAWNNVIKPVFEKIGSVWSTVFEGVKSAFNRVWDGIKLLFTDFPEFVKRVFNKVIRIFNGLFDGIVEAFKQIPRLIGSVWNGIVNIFKGGINLLVDGLNKVLFGKKFTVPSWVPVIGGETFGFDKLPKFGSGEKLDLEQVITGGYRDIPSLARGGTVLPRMGGTLVRVAEAGRPERVEPLDESGLSKRDRAMISALSGGLAGASINVYPSARMDEVELAALVSRQIAFQLRKGAA